MPTKSSSPTSSLARARRNIGQDVDFLTGLDEHG